jgi:hypothetical protein
MMPPATFRKLLLSSLAIFLAAARSQGGFPAPPPPKDYDVEIRYQIYAGRNQRIAQFRAMMAYLESIGFHKNPAADPHYEEEDTEETRMSGTIASTNLKKILLERYVKALLIKPAGLKLPEELDKPVKVQLELASGFPLDRQRVLADQVRDKLASFQFHEAIGYDNRGHTRLVGWLPVGYLENLLKDLRWEPAGWFAPNTPAANLPEPLKSVSPILITEVLEEPAGPPKPLPPPAGPPKGEDHSLKMTPELRELAAKEEAPKSVRMEVILTYAPEEFDEDWRRQLLLSVPGLVIEGRQGSILTVAGSPKQAPALAQMPIAATIRLPRPAFYSLQKAENIPGDNRQFFQATGLARLHAQGKRGQRVRVAVIDGDFRGYERFKGKGLPANIHYADLTTDRNYNLEPDAFPGDPNGFGHGTQCALALALAAPEADLTLIRIDPAAPYQILSAARLISGEPFRSEGIKQREEELAFETSQLRKRRERLLQERKEVLDNFGQEEDIVQKRNEYFKKQAELDADERSHQRRLERFTNLFHEQRSLKGIQIVSCSLAWNEDYPLGGRSPLSRFCNRSPGALWFFPAGNTRDQCWAGLFRDVDGNGVMEFAPPDTPLHAERWTRELNFLAWRPFGKDPGPEMPAKARIRLSIQWPEVHDPEFSRSGDDVYREPLAKLNLVILRQRDPSGSKLPADDMELVVRSEGLAQRIQNERSAASYEHTVEFAVDSPGRYAVRVEGRVSPGTRPADSATVPAQQKTWELKPRILVEVVDEASRLIGRPVFLDYVTNDGTLGVPGDAHGLITVGAADETGKPEIYSTAGPALNLNLLVKPDLLTFDQLKVGPITGPLAYGTSLATPFAAGQAAVLLGAKAPAAEAERWLHRRQGTLLHLP